MSVTILCGDALDQLKTLPDESVHCVVTSPPYFGLRDYGHEGQIGIEDSPQEFVAALVEVFREVRRVLRSDGTAWVNLGDSYSQSGKGGNPEGSEWSGFVGNKDREASAKPRPMNAKSFGMKPKDLVGIPWRVAFALQADGWYLRQDIIWHKPNPMPESVRDRCTKSHEYIFLLAKSMRYYFDQLAIMEPLASSSVSRLAQDIASQKGSDRVPGKTNGTMKAVRRSGNKERKAATERGCPRDGVDGSIPWEGSIRNKRSVWTVTTQPFKEAHFATFPPALIEPCILAGCPPGGVVLDPFGGAGTTGLVADRLQRDAILIELNPAYADMAERRIRNDAPLFESVQRGDR